MTDSSFIEHESYKIDNKLSRTQWMREYMREYRQKPTKSQTPHLKSTLKTTSENQGTDASLYNPAINLLLQQSPQVINEKEFISYSQLGLFPEVIVQQPQPQITTTPQHSLYPKLIVQQPAPTQFTPGFQLLIQPAPTQLTPTFHHGLYPGIIVQPPPAQLTPTFQHSLFPEVFVQQTPTQLTSDITKPDVNNKQQLLQCMPLDQPSQLLQHAPLVPGLKIAAKCPKRKECTRELINTSNTSIEEGKPKRKDFVWISNSTLKKRLKLDCIRKSNSKPLPKLTSEQKAFPIDGSALITVGTKCVESRKSPNVMKRREKLQSSADPGPPDIKEPLQRIRNVSDLLVFKSDDETEEQSQPRPDSHDNSDDSSQKYSEDHTTLAPSGYKCDSCKLNIFGFRYTCVQCVAYNLCARCEGLKVHADHYMLRIPSGKSNTETERVLNRIRLDLKFIKQPKEEPKHNNEGSHIVMEVLDTRPDPAPFSYPPEDTDSTMIQDPIPGSLPLKPKRSDTQTAPKRKEDMKIVYTEFQMKVLRSSEVAGNRSMADRTCNENTNTEVEIKEEPTDPECDHSSSSLQEIAASNLNLVQMLGTKIPRVILDPTEVERSDTQTTVASKKDMKVVNTDQPNTMRSSQLEVNGIIVDRKLNENRRIEIKEEAIDTEDDNSSTFLEEATASSPNLVQMLSTKIPRVILDPTEVECFRNATHTLCRRQSMRHKNITLSSS